MMDLFILDKLVITFVKGLMTNSYVQFATLAGLWVVSEIVFPNKKVNKK